jgi:hypothetical protein
MGVEREEPSKGAQIKFFKMCSEVIEYGNYRLIALKSIIKHRFNVKPHLSLYLPYSPTQFSSYITKIFYLHLDQQANIFLLLVTIRAIRKCF